MANETNTESGNTTLQKILAQGKQVNRADVAPDGTVTILQTEAKLQSVDVADIDLLLSFTDGTYVIIPNGALDAISEIPHTVLFSDTKDSLSNLFKMVGISNPAKVGSLRVVSENIDAAKPPTEEFLTPSDEQIPETLPAPAPMVKVSAGASLTKGPGKGPGMGGSGEGEGEVPATVSPLATPQPPVYRVGKKSEVSVQDLLNGLGLGEQPNFTQTLYTSREFKVSPSGRTDIPLGAYDANLTSGQLELRSGPAGQSTRELVYGTAGNDTIAHNSAFSSGVAQWSKTLHLTFNNFSEVSAIEMVISSTKLALLQSLGVDFKIQGTGVSQVSANTWSISPSTDIFGYGQDIQIVYNVSDSTVDAVDFGADITVTGKTGPLNFEVTNNITLTWREATTESDFTVPGTSGYMMVLPRAGVGYEFFGGDGDDTVYAGAGHDLAHGETGNDTLYGQTGNDTLDGGLGSDALDGGQGTDTATYINATTGVVAALQTGLLANTNEAAGDTYVNIENLTGSVYGDTLIGDAQANILTGLTGDDTLIGLGNGDTLNGGDGTDTASYAYATSAVTVSLTSNTGTQGEADGDTLVSIENLTGSGYNDTFTGAHGIQANAFDGRGGNDTVSYAVSQAGVIATLDPSLLLTPLAQTNDAAGDAFTNIENLTGTAYNDTLIGNTDANVLTGGDGNDLLEGLAAGDSFSGGNGTDTVSYANSTAGVVSSLTSLFTAGPAVVQANDALGDTYSGIENMIGTALDDTLIGDSGNNRIEGSIGNDTLEGMAGADQLIGGSNTDTASYVHAASYVKASLTTGLSGFSNEGDAAGDTYDGIENMTGSGFNDTLIGDGEINTLLGGDGDDVLEGMGGADVLNGGNGSNTASYEHGSDQGAGTGVTASLAAPAGNTGDAAGDTYTNIQNLIGSAYNDTLAGDTNDNTLTAGAGNDTITGGAGTDILYGGSGNDTLYDDLVGAARLYGEAGDDTITFSAYDSTIDIIDGGSGSDTLVSNYTGSGQSTVNLHTGSISFPTGSATLISIENYTALGSNTAYVYASNENNVIIGGSTLNDYVDYRNAIAGVNVNLDTGVVSGGSGSDTLSNIEHILGSQWNDTIIGNAANNTIRGSYGADYIDGGAGIDTWYVDWGGAATTASLLTTAQNAAMGIIMTGDAAGKNVVNMENITASYGDWVYGNQVDNNLYGRGMIEGFVGNDVIRGNGTSAVASYANAGNSYLASLGITTANGTGVTANLTTTAFTNGGQVTNSGDAAGDTYTNINSLYGSAYNDQLVGNSAINTLIGAAGNDTLEGLGGADVLRGGSGNDTVSYAHANAGILVDIDNNSVRAALMTGDAEGDNFFEIENIIGSSFNDSLYGDNYDNILTGGLGNDLLDGGSGFDTASYADASGTVNIDLTSGTVTGSAGTDTLVSIERIIGSGYADTIIGTAGDDILDGGAGADTLNGGGGSDTVSYATAAGGRDVNLSSGVNTDNDTYISIENIIGSAYGETLVGDSGDNIIEGGLGNDTLNGNTGSDTASYTNATAGITVSLGLGTAQNTGGAGIDTLSSFENLLGSAYNDTLTGDAGANILNGGTGDDLLIAGAGGADTLIGGTGTDTASFVDAGTAVTITINGSGTNSDGAAVTLTGIENLTGSTYNDTLTGDNLDNLIIGGLGDDTINGMGGSDTVSYAAAAATVTVNLANTGVNVSGGAGNDSLSNIENIIGSVYADTITGDGAANIIEGGAGADTMVGDSGSDTASYEHSDAGVSVTVNATSGNTGGHAAGDSLSGFENLTGSAFNDTLSGDLNNNVLSGGAGDDLLLGGAGADTLYGGTGSDTASYQGSTAAVSVNLTTGVTSGGHAVGDTLSSIENLIGSSYNDSLYGDASNNVINGGLGSDTLYGYAGNDTLDVQTGRDTAYGGDGDDLFYVDSQGTVANENLPTLVNGENNTSWAYGGGDTIKLFNLGGSYSLTTLAGVTNYMEILDIRDGSSTDLSIVSLDVRNFVDGGNASQIWIKADSGDSIDLSGLTLVGDSSVPSSGIAGTTDYTIYNSSNVQVAQIHWQTA
jgi:Ca2+-binding RTX toxin-like protein